MQNIAGSIITADEDEGNACPFCGETEAEWTDLPYHHYAFLCGYASGKYSHHAPRIVMTPCQRHSLTHQMRSWDKEDKQKHVAGVEAIKSKYPWLRKQA